MFCRKRILLFSLLIAVLVSGTAEAGGVVLALSGGGSRGLAHIGVIEVLQEEGIPIVGIVGTIMGAISGGLVAVATLLKSSEGLPNGYGEHSDGRVNPSIFLRA